MLRSVSGEAVIELAITLINAPNPSSHPLFLDAALVEKARAQERQDEAVMELAKAKEQLTQLASTRGRSDLDATK